MQSYGFIVYLVVLPWVIMGQLPLSNSGQYGLPVVGEGSQQQLNQGNVQNPSIQLPSVGRQSSNDQLPSSSSSDRYLVGNLSESFTFQVASPSIKVTYLGLNGYSLYIMGVGFSNKSQFNYDEQNNRLTIHSLDTTTVGYYSAVDTNWQTFTTIISAINVSSLQIHNSHVSEDNNGSSLVSCSVSIIRSTFKLPEPLSQSNNPPIISPVKLTGTENLPRLDLFLSSRTSSTLLNKKFSNDTLNGQNFTRIMTLQRSLTRAENNETIQCQVESTNNIDVYLVKTVPINIEFGPNLETGAMARVNLESEVLKMVAMECQVESNPLASYVWYEMLSNISKGMMSDYGPQTSLEQYSLQSPSAGQSVFGTTRQIQRLYQYPGQYAMQCQAQSRGKTIKQEFFISVIAQSNAMKTSADMNQSGGKSNRIPLIIGISIGGILILLLVAILIAVIIYLKRRKSDPNTKHSISTEKLPNDKQGKTRWGGLPVDYSKYKNEALKVDSSSTSHLVESAENSSIQGPPIPSRPSPMASTHSSYRQAPPTSISLSYRQASLLPGFRPPAPLRSYSPEQDDGDEVSASINAMPVTINRSRTTTPLGSHKSLSESIQSLRSNQQAALSLPVKKRPLDPPTLPAPIIPKREQKSPSPKYYEKKKDYENHHYHNPAQLRAQQKTKTTDNTSSEDEGENEQQPKQYSEASAGTASTTSGYNQVDFHHQHGRRIITPPPPQRIVVHQPHDEVPPAYHQVANTSSPSTAYVYQEPTEV